ncbi:MAG: leucine-rich repeat protein [Clostridia bacterium]|nr:leucine-rich repeat protein [Clostridia bacterium]
MKVKKSLLRVAVLLMTMALTSVAFAACDSEPTNDTSVSDSVAESVIPTPARYVVNFNTDGGTAVSSQTVTEGKAVSAPEAPEKTGYVFVGWYADAGFNAEYDFSSPITGNTTIYARFAEYRANDFNVEYIVNGEVYATDRTAEGYIYNMPAPEREGDTFVGWWMSDYNDEDMLTAKFDGREIFEDVKLFAVWASDGDMVSVTSDKISWQAKGANQTYYVTVTNPDGEEYVYSTQAPYYEYNFADAAAGNYVVSVRIGRVTATAYYRNKALARVTHFNIENDSLLYFDGVPGAEKYYLSIECGNEDHNHGLIDLGANTYYDFSACEMKEGGISFTVTAYAEGKAPSYSREVVLNNEMAPISGLTVTNGYLTWNAVDGAEYYSVSVNGDNYLVSTNSLSVLEASGTLNVTVGAFRARYNPSYASLTYEKQELASPSGLAVSGNVASWNAVEGATGYTLKVGDAEYEVAGTSYELPAITADTAIAVKANGANASYYSEAVTVTTANVTGLAYSDKAITWNAVYGVDEYYVKLNDSDAYAVNGTSAPLALAKKGDNTITVGYGDGHEQTITVYAYELTYVVNGGEALANEYFAEGDVAMLAAPTYDGHVFGGWYATETAGMGGNKYKQATFGAEDLTVYAKWTYADIPVTLVYGNGYDTEVVDITYGSYYDLPALESKDGLMLFTGWYTEDKAEGVKIADENGNYVNNWDLLTTTKLYAGWLEILKVNEIENGTAYSVEAGSFINNVRTITIPEQINGKPVTYIEAKGFEDAVLTEVNIPDTIKTMEFHPLTHSFKNCYYLRNINVYATDNPDKGNYFSEDGILYYNNTVSENAGIEIRFVPLGKTGVLYIPDFVEIIPFRAISYSAFYEIHIPASVWLVDTEAIVFNNTNLRSIIFDATPAGQEELPLTIGDYAFQTNQKIEEITLPARLTTLVNNVDSATGEERMRVFENCTKLEAINVESGCENYSSKDGLLCTGDGTEIIIAPENFKPEGGVFTIPTGVLKVDDYAFLRPRNITKLIVPGYVANIGKYAFAMTDASTAMMTSIVFEGVTDDRTLSIGQYAFYGQSNLTEINIPANVVSIGKGAFGNTPRLITVNVDSYGAINYENGAFIADNGTSYIRELHIGKNVGDVSSIGGVFGTTYLKKVVVDPENTHYYSTTEEEDGFGGVVYDYNKTRILFYPNALQGPYTLLATATEIPASVFEGRTGLSAVTVGANVTSIGKNAFKGCTLLSSVTFVDGGTDALSIGESAFESCTALTSFNVIDRTASIGKNAFKGTTAMHTLTIEDGTQPLTIGEYAFSTTSTSSGGGLIIFKLPGGSTTTYTCQLNGELYIPARVTSIGNYAFAGAAGITAITFAEGGTADLTVGNYAFKGLGASALALPERTKSLGTYSFDGAAITTLSLNEGLTSIGDYAFNACEHLEAVAIPSTVTTMGTASSFMVFAGCTALNTMTVAEGNTAFTASSNVLYSLSNGNATKILFATHEVDSLTIPASVTNVSAGAFKGNTSLTSLVFEGTGTAVTIGDNAFYGCTALETVTLPEGLTTIGAFAFKNCTALTAVNIPSTVTTISKGAFFGCSALATLTFAEGGTSALTIQGSTAPMMGSAEWGGVFSGTAISEVTFPARTKDVGANAFSDSRTTGVSSNATATAAPLTTVTFKTPLDGITLTIGNYAFSNTTLEQVIFEDGVNLTTIGQYTFRNTNLTSITVPASVTKIDQYAFYGCAQLTTVTLPDAALASIGNSAFANSGLTSFSFPETTASKLTLGTNLFNGCANLTYMYLSSKVTTLVGLLDGCTSVTSMAISGDNTNLYMNNGVIYNGQRTAILLIVGQVVGALDIPEGVEEIGEGAFSAQAGITSVTVPASVKTIGATAFKGCTGITSFIIADDADLTTIGDNAFEGDVNMATFSFGANSKVTSLGKYAFKSCGFSEITLPAGVTYVSEGLFDSEKQTSSSTSLPYGAVTNPCKIERVTYLGTISYIDKYAFRGCIYLQEINIPDTVTYIGWNAFNYCYGVTSLKLPAHDLSFEAGTAYFTYMYNLESVVVPEGMTTLPSYMFDGCTALTSVTLPSTLETFNSYTFRGCTALETVTLPEGVKTLGANMFLNCTALTSVNIPVGVTAIPNYCFQNTGITSITLGDTVTSVGTSAFQNCTSLVSADLGNGVTTLGNNVFYGCSALETVTLPSGIGTIPQSMFNKCSALELVTIPDSVASIGTTAFASSGVKEVRIGAGVSSITSGAFGSCASLEKFVVSANNPYYYSDAEGILYDSDNVIVLFPSGKSGEVTIAAGAVLGEGVFMSCTLITKVTLPEGLLAVPKNTFKSCTALEEVVLPSTITNIGESAFEGCSLLTSVNIPEGVTVIGKYAFKGCTVLGNVTLPENLASLGAYAFQNAKAITAIEIPAGITTIDANTFDGCTALTSVTLHEGLTTLCADCFKGCTAIAELYMPSTFNNIVKGNQDSSGGLIPRFKIIGPGGGGTTTVVNPFTNWTASQKIYVTYASANDLPTALAVLKNTTNVKAQVIYGYTPGQD